MIHNKFLLPILCGALCFALLLGFTSANAASSSEIRDQIHALEQEQDALAQQMEKLEAQLTENAEQLQQMVAERQTIDQQINLLHALIINANEQISVYAVLIADKQLELEKAEQNLAQLNLSYKERIRAMEEAGELSYWTILFESRSITDFLDRLNMIQEIARSDRRRLEQIRAAAREVTLAQKELEAEQSALEDARAELEGTQLLLQEKSQHSQELVLQLLAKGEEYETLLEEAEQEDEKLMQEIAMLEDDFDDAVYQEWLATYVPPTTAPEVEYPAVGDSGWLTPVSDYRLSSPFGMRLHPILGVYRMHSGVDMACPEGTPIYATRGGKVTIAKYSSSAGNYVQINHGDGYASVYMHMTEYVVSVGDYVAQGQLIGYVGNTGLSKGNHLHFGISYNGEYVNPMEFIG